MVIMISNLSGFDKTWWGSLLGYSFFAEKHKDQDTHMALPRTYYEVNTSLLRALHRLVL